VWDCLKNLGTVGLSLHGSRRDDLLPRPETTQFPETDFLDWNGTILHTAYRLHDSRRTAERRQISVSANLMA
jgi:hypothetical protein